MMQNKALQFAVLLVAVLGLLAGRARAEVGPQIEIKDTVKESFKVRPGGTLHLDLDRGNIEVLSRSGDAVIIEMERTVDVDSRADAKRILENHSYDWDQRGNDVFLESRYEPEESGIWGRWRSGDRFKLQVRVYVPERYNVDFTSGTGNVRIADIDGRVEGRTGAGNIEAGAVRGSVDVSSGSGNVSIDSSTGRVKISTGAGNVKLRNVAGELEVHTGAGNVEAEIIRQPGAASRLESGAGNVTVYLSGRVGVDVRASSGVGSASTDFPLEVEGKWMSRSFGGPVNGGGPALYMHTGVGNIALLRR